jgi:hypothetical protein
MKDIFHCFLVSVCSVKDNDLQTQTRTRTDNQHQPASFLSHKKSCSCGPCIYASSSNNALSAVDAIVLLADRKVLTRSLTSHCAQLCCKAWRPKAVSFAPLSTRSKIRDLLESMHYHNQSDAVHSWQQLTSPCYRYF